MISFVDNVMEELGPLWSSQWFQIPAFFFVLILGVCLVKWIIRGQNLDV